MKEKYILNMLSQNIRKYIKSMDIDYDNLTEIRLRVNEPLVIKCRDEEMTNNNANNAYCGYIVTPRDIKETVDYISSFSLYAYESELSKGYITVQGGHRVGLCGQVVLEHGRVKSVKHISFINIRICHQVKGCAENVIPYIMDQGRLNHTLIISPPGCGKTTLLRDIIRKISDGNESGKGLNVGVVDERSEIAACYMGAPQNDVGRRTDILDCCPKAEGMLMLIRSMSPDVIAVDEIGTREDIDAISYIINCGCSIIATVHGESVDDIRNKPVLRKLVQERVFERFIVLSNKNGGYQVESIFDERGNSLKI